MPTRSLSKYGRDHSALTPSAMSSISVTPSFMYDESRILRPMPGADRDVRFTSRKPYSAIGPGLLAFGVTNDSVGTLLFDAGPPYTEINVGYFFDGSKFD